MTPHLAPTALSVGLDSEKLKSLAELAQTRLESGHRAARVAGAAIHALDAQIAIVQRVVGEGNLETLAVSRGMEINDLWLEQFAARAAAEIVARREKLNFSNFTSFSLEKNLPLEEKLNRYLGVPLYGPEQKVIGVATVFSKSTRPFSDEDEWWLSVAAGLIADALNYETLENQFFAFKQKVNALTIAPIAPEFPATEEIGKNKGSVLVIDDDRAFNHVICGYLKDEGYEAESAFDGLEAMRLFRPNAFDAVMTDVAMPHMNGWELIAALRVRAPEIPIVLITAYSSGMWNENYLQQHGVAAVLNKPFKLERLRSILSEVVPIPH
ncbi:MAG TPA: response regulator [Pyrinomonadaceae bacterium]|nr:response regulator [Pyrinomonadaceae bacterium]